MPTSIISDANPVVPPMKVALIGLGFAARSLHLPALVALNGVEVVGGFDVSADQRRSWNELGIAPASGSIEEMFEERAPDVVVVGTPPDTHGQYCISAIDAGANVLCEKPFVATSTEADEVLAHADAAGVSIAVNHEFRFMPIFSTLADAVGGRDVGRPVMLQCLQLMDLAPWDEKVPWRAAMPERSLFEGGVHLVDLMHMVIGRLPLSVSASTSSGLDPTKVADAIHLVTLDYGEGVLGQITIQRLCRSGTRYVELRVDCEQASLRASFGGRAFARIGLKRAEAPGIRIDYGPEGLSWLERGHKRRVLGRNPRGATALATQSLWEATIDAWRRGVVPPTAATTARDTLKVIEASYESARTGRRVEVRAAAV